MKHALAVTAKPYKFSSDKSGWLINWEGNIMTGSIKLIYGEKEYQLPLMEGSEGEKAIDISKLRQETGLITLDPGYANTGSCTSSITFMDGEKGVLRYRGIPVEQLAEKSTFKETAYLLINGKLPKQKELTDFSILLNDNSLVHEDMTVTRLLSKVRTLAAMSYKISRGHKVVYPRPDLTYCANFLNMMFDSPVQPYEIDPDVVKALNVFWILHADHEQNCSTTSVRVVGSARVNLYAAISAGIAALWGPLHGGANQAVIEMLTDIADNKNMKRVIERAKDKNDPFRLMGFGHRVYKTFDPRMKIMKNMCDTLLEKLKFSDPLLEIAVELEQIALNDDYFIEHNLYPNVDFYSGIVLRAIGIPTNMFTVMFAIGRLPGWIAQWKESIDDPNWKLCRPRQIYTGPNNTRYVPIEER
jgi:citrate synthase